MGWGGAGKIICNMKTSWPFLCALLVVVGG